MEFWPLFDLRVVTPRLMLVYPTDQQIEELARLAAAGVHGPDFMPFNVPWSRQESPNLERGTLQYHWRARAEWTADAWSLDMVALVDGEVAGTQGIGGRAFPVTRAVSSGSWLGRSYQGRGLGKEMRAAILHLAFAGLGAEVATTSAFEDNAASLGVTRSLGYLPNGWQRFDRDGKAVQQLHFILPRSAWAERRRDDITIEGLEACLPMFGLSDR